MPPATFPRASYEQDGFLSPLDALTSGEAAQVLEELQSLERLHGCRLTPRLLAQLHWYYRWAYELATHAVVLDAVETVIGPNILLWSSQVFYKYPSSGRSVGWHQDLRFWDLRPAVLTTAWIAITRSDGKSGCLKVVRGSHRGPTLAHLCTFDDESLLDRGQHIPTGVPRDAVVLDLLPGQMSLHDVNLIHGSDENFSSEPRIGIALRYIPTFVREHPFARCTMLVRGRDDYGHFPLRKYPEGDVAAGFAAQRHDYITALEFASASRADGATNE